MKAKKKDQQQWKQPYQRIIIEVTVILMICTVMQGNPHHSLEQLIQLLIHWL